MHDVSPLYSLIFPASLDVPPALLSAAFLVRFVAVLLAGFAAFDGKCPRPTMRIVFAAMLYFVALDFVRVHRFDPFYAGLSVPYTGEAARVFAVETCMDVVGLGLAAAVACAAFVGRWIVLVPYAATCAIVSGFLIGGYPDRWYSRGDGRAAVFAWFVLLAIVPAWLAVVRWVRRREPLQVEQWTGLALLLASTGMALGPYAVFRPFPFTGHSAYAVCLFGLAYAISAWGSGKWIFRDGLKLSV
jgi:hypothetical protein